MSRTKEYTKLPARSDTAQKYRALAAAKHWTVTEAVRQAVEALAQREGIDLSTDSRRRKAS